MVCTYNERDNLPSLLESIAKYVPDADVLIVDDNSPDGTGKWVEAECQRNPKLMLITRPGKMGFPGIPSEWAPVRNRQRLRPNRQFDADFSHDPVVIPKLIEATIRKHSPCDIAIGSRYVEGGRSLGYLFSGFG
jgi:dolichol-phosphate mannosyltransferase